MLNIVHADKPISDFDDVEYRDLVNRMNDRYEEVGALSFPDNGDTDNVLIIFSGYLEIFYMMSVARPVKCQVIYFQDRFSQWYQGSTLLPDIETIVRDHLPDLIGDRRPVFFGQSSGGYAALVAAAWTPNGLGVACSPQVMADRKVKEEISLPSAVKLHVTPDGIVDIPALWAKRGTQTGQAAVIFSLSEASNPATDFFWMDYLHSLPMIGLEGVKVFLMYNDVHAVVHRHARPFSELIAWLIDQPGDIHGATPHIRAALDAMEKH